MQKTDWNNIKWESYVNNVQFWRYSQWRQEVSPNQGAKSGRLTRANKRWVKYTTNLLLNGSNQSHSGHVGKRAPPVVLATRRCLVSSGRQKFWLAETCVHPSSDWSMIEYSAARVQVYTVFLSTPREGNHKYQKWFRLRN